MKKTIIIGAGDFAKELIWIMQDINKKQATYDIVGLSDDNEAKEGLKVMSFNIYGPIEDSSFWGEGPVYAVCSAGKPKNRRSLTNRARKAGYKFLNIIAPGAVVSEYARIGEGTIIMPGSVVTVDVTLGKHVLVNKLCSVGHDSVIKDYSTLAPGVKIGGNVLIEEESYIGMNASILESVNIGKGAIVGAGAVVIDDLPPGCTAVGVPARVIK